MKAYYSYWSKGYRKKPDEFYLNMTKLSAYFAKKNYKEIHLITDSESYEDFNKIVKWDSISTDLDILPEKYSHVWSLGKILCFKIAAERNDHFIHIDSDVIIWERLPDFIDKADIFCQSREGHVSEWKSINSLYSLKNKYYISNEIKPYISPNCGIIGGKDLEFIYKYASTALNLVLDKENADFWIKDNLNHFEKAVLAEQYYLAICAEKFNKYITYLLLDGSEEECKHKKYTHLLGAKNDPLTHYKIKEALSKLEM